MDIFGQYLDNRELEPEFPPLRLSAAERLVKFDEWLFHKLWKTLQWEWAGDEINQRRRCHQARIYVQRVVMDLWRRGWLLDGSRLAARILEPLEKIAKYQKAGAIRDFWPYFCGTIDRYVGTNAEEIQAEARSLGATMGQLVADLGLKQGPKPPTMPELLVRRVAEVAEAQEVSLRERIAVLRRKEAEEREGKKQLNLF